MATRNCGRPPLGCRSDIFCREKQSPSRDGVERIFTVGQIAGSLFFSLLCSCFHSESSTSNSRRIFINLYSAILIPLQISKPSGQRILVTWYLWYCNIYWLMCIYLLLQLYFFHKQFVLLFMLILFGEFCQKLPQKVSLHRRNIINFKEDQFRTIYRYQLMTHSEINRSL